VHSGDEQYVWTYERGCHPKGSLTYGRHPDSVYITWICRCNSEYCNDNVVDGTEEECHPAGGGGGGGGGGGIDFGVSNFRRQSNCWMVALLIAIYTVTGIISSTQICF